tara:strand:+ start:11616 stop:12527 length:912 start_codon:yes stop_codon:yes gene_type:complete
MDNILNSEFKNIAKNHVAFCILGGPSSKELDNIQDIIKNNFTITVNRSIELYPNADMFITSDNNIAREYFEDREFFLHKFRGGKFLKDKANFKYDEEPLWVKGKRNILLKNPNLVKIIACNDFPSYNTSFSTGQLYKYKGIEYAKQVKNTYICIEHRNPQGESYPVLSPYIEETIENYGTDPLKFYPGGNASGIMFQLLWYMGFKKMVVVGYGDKGKSVRSDDYEEIVDSFYDENNTEFEWSQEEIHGMVTHYNKWGDNFKILKGGGICKEYCDFKQASYNDLEKSPLKKNKLIDKLLKLSNG